MTRIIRDDDAGDCALCGTGATYRVMDGDKPTVALCADCVAGGQDAAALRALRRARELRRQVDAWLDVSELIDDAENWPGRATVP